MSMSVDGYVAGPHDGFGRGLGAGGEAIHNWIMGGPWTYAEGPQFSATGPDREQLDGAFAGSGAVIVGRRMYDVVDGWGEEAAFPVPVFVLTSRPHPKRELDGSSYTFVTDGMHSALAQAQAVAGDREVTVGGGARVAQQYLAAGLVDELALHIAPVLVGAGTRLFEDIGADLRDLTIREVVQSPYATHIRYALR